MSFLIYTRPLYDHVEIIRLFFDSFLVSIKILLATVDKCSLMYTRGWLLWSTRRCSFLAPRIFDRILRLVKRTNSGLGPPFRLDLGNRCAMLMSVLETGRFSLSWQYSIINCSLMSLDSVGRSVELVEEEATSEYFSGKPWNTRLSILLYAVFWKFRLECRWSWSVLTSILLINDDWTASHNSIYFWFSEVWIKLCSYGIFWVWEDRIYQFK